MKIWISIAKDGEPDDGLGVSMQVKFNPVPTKDKRSLRWELAEPVRNGFHITHASEFGPIDVRHGGDGN